MAKKNRGAAEGMDNESGGSRMITVLIAIIIILIWLVVFAFLIKLDVGGIGSNVLYPVLKDVPVVNNILPDASEEQQASEGNYRYNTLKSANARIEELERKLEFENGVSASNSDSIEDLNAEVQRLRRYKDDYDAFAKRVAEFDEKVVLRDNAPDISEYRKYYEEISPENAEQIYKQVVEAERYSEMAETLATFYAGEDPASAAEQLAVLSEDLDLVCDILLNMKESNASAILQEMDSTYAAQVTKKIAASRKNN